MRDLPLRDGAARLVRRLAGWHSSRRPMTLSESYPSAFAADVAEALRRCVVDGQALLTDLAGNLDPASPAVAELADEAVLADPAWGEHPVASAHADVRLRVGFIEDQLNALSELLASTRCATPFALHALMRPLLEAAGVGTWLLADPGNARRRVTRWVSDWQVSLQQRFGALHKVGMTDTESTEKRRQLLAGMGRHGLTREKPPEYADRIVRQLSEMFTDDGHRALYYAYLAGIGHAERWALREFLERADATQDDAVVSAYIVLKDQAVGAIGYAGVVGYLHLLGAAADLYGDRDQVRSRRWRGTVVETLELARRSLPTVPPP